MRVGDKVGRIVLWYVMEPVKLLTPPVRTTARGTRDDHRRFVKVGETHFTTEQEAWSALLRFIDHQIVGVEVEEKKAAVVLQNLGAEAAKLRARREVVAQAAQKSVKSAERAGGSSQVSKPTNSGE